MHDRDRALEGPSKAIPPLLALTALAFSPACRDEPGGSDGAGAVLSDELSMPLEPTLSMDSFTQAERCGGCHVTHYAEWRASHHANAMTDPVYRALVAVRQEDYLGQQDRFCLQCHSSIGTRGGDIVPGFDFADLQPITLEGVTCESCHKVTALARPFNSGHALDPDGPMRGTIAAPVASAFHESEYSPLHGTSAFCSGCHDVREVSGLVLESPFAEWQESPAATAGVNCQDCHMPTYEGQAAAGGPTRTLHRHTWIGVDVPLGEGILAPGQEAELRAGVKALLAGAATVTVAAPSPLRAGDPLDLRIEVRNNIIAHNFPTGSTFNRQAWVEVLVRDGDGEVIFETGTLDEHGDLKSTSSGLAPHADPDLIQLGSVLADHQGRPVIFPWRAAEHASSALRPLQARVFTLHVPTPGAPGPLSVEARLLFRAFAPHALRTLGLDEYVDRLEIHEVSKDSASVELVPRGA